MAGGADHPPDVWRRARIPRQGQEFLFGRRFKGAGATYPCLFKIAMKCAWMLRGACKRKTIVIPGEHER
jgi:hypothetical protein